MKKLRGILVDTRNGISVERIDYENYWSITELLGCKWITCVPRVINGHVVDIYCDEEALLKQEREPAILTRDENKQIIEILFGNCFICLHNKKGDVKNIPHKLIGDILLSQGSVTTIMGKTYQVLQCTLK